MKDVILGAGISGRILKHFIPDAIVYESGCPSIHLNSSVGANYVWQPLEGFDCKPVQVFTTVDGLLPSSESIRRYKNKVGKDNENEEDWAEQFRPVQSGYLLRHETVPAMYNMKCVEISLNDHRLKFEDGSIAHYDTLFSTIPLPVLCQLCRMDVPVKTAFRYIPIFVKVEVDEYPSPSIIVDYVSSPCAQEYRVTRRCGEIHRESLHPFVGPHKVLWPGKIWNSPMVQTVLTRLLHHGVVCFGRYASWNSDELIHQTYAKVQQFIQQGE